MVNWNDAEWTTAVAEHGCKEVQEDSSEKLWGKRKFYATHVQPVNWVAHK